MNRQFDDMVNANLRGATERTRPSLKGSLESLEQRLRDCNALLWNAEGFLLSKRKAAKRFERIPTGIYSEEGQWMRRKTALISQAHRHSRGALYESMRDNAEDERLVGMDNWEGGVNAACCLSR